MKVLKAVLVAIGVGGLLIASFYLAYLLLLLAVLAAAGGCAYLYFNWDEISKDIDFPD